MRKKATIIKALELNLDHKNFLLRTWRDAKLNPVPNEEIIAKLENDIDKVRERIEVLAWVLD